MRIFTPTKIKERRNELNITQAELAIKAGTARVYIVEIEHGKKIPRVTMLAKIANALNVSESYFFVNNGS